MTKRTPNPYNDRASRVADALMLAAHQRGVTPGQLSRKEAREILKERGLYTSEGSLSRDLAAIRKAIPEFGGPRTAWAQTAYKQITVDGERRYLIRADLLPRAAHTASTVYAAMTVDGLVTTSVKAYTGEQRDAILWRARERLSTLMVERETSEPPAWASRCPRCGAHTSQFVWDPVDREWGCPECVDTDELFEGLDDDEWGDDSDENPDFDLWVMVDEEEARRWIRYI